MKNTFKEFVKYASLNVLGMIGLSCYILADTFFIAKGLGANGLTALNLAIPIYSFIHGSGLMLGMGGATRYSLYKSQKAVKQAHRTYTHTITLTLACAAVFFVTGLFFTHPITRMLGANEAVFQMCNTYLKVILLFAPIFMLNNVLLCFVRNDGGPQLSMTAMVGGSFSNIVLDYIFIFPGRMGIFGAVLATGLAPLISILILSPFFLQKKNHFHLTKCKLSGRLSGSILSCGVPSLLTEVSSGIVIIVFNTIVLKLQGNIGVAAYGVIANLSLVVIAVYTGIAQGIQPIISRHHGAGRRAKVQATLRYALITMLLISGFLYSCLFWGAAPIVNIFNREQNAILQELAVTGLKIYFTACVFAGFNIIMSVYFTSTESARPAQIISILRGFLIIIPLAFWLSSAGGMIGTWFVFPLTELIVSGIGFSLYRFRQKKTAAGLS